MATLLSGLPEQVADEENLARFLPHRSLVYAVTRMPKPAAFLPNPKDWETSVSRHGSEPVEGLWAIGREVMAASGRTLFGATVFKTRAVRAAQLEVTASEPPPRHAGIRGWPWIEGDPESQKAEQMKRAALIAREAGAAILHC